MIEFGKEIEKRKSNRRMTNKWQFFLFPCLFFEQTIRLEAYSSIHLVWFFFLFMLVVGNYCAIWHVCDQILLHMCMYSTHILLRTLQFCCKKKLLHFSVKLSSPLSSSLCFCCLCVCVFFCDMLQFFKCYCIELSLSFLFICYTLYVLPFIYVCLRQNFLQTNSILLLFHLVSILSFFLLLYLMCKFLLFIKS